MSWLARVLCSHPHDRRERDADGRLWLVCAVCDRRVVALSRPTDYPQEVTK